MHRALILAAVAATLAVPASAQATGADRSNAAKECRFERGTTDATRAAFAIKYRNFGKCVSTRARDEARERENAQRNASQKCRAERGTTAASRAAFEQKYGTNGNKRNAFGKCVSQAAKAAKEQADAADREKAADRKRAAKACAQERAKDRAAFERKYGTNANRRDAFGKCVSKRS